MVHTWTGKPGKMSKLFPAREKSGHSEQTGKVRDFTQNTVKIREFYRKYWKIEGHFRQILFLSDFLVEVPLFFIF